MFKRAWLAAFLLIAALSGLALLTRPATHPTQIGAPLPSTAPEAQGLDSAQLAAVLTDMQAANAEVRSVVVLRNGYLVLEAYAPGYTPETLQDVRSVTKSVLALVLAAAEQRRELPPLNQPALDVLGSTPFGSLTQGKAAITLEHLLTMQSGLAAPNFTENYRAYSVYAAGMTRAEDWVAYVLGGDMAEPPGTSFNYNDGASQVISAVLTATLGQPVADYATTALFRPLGIQVAWASDPQANTLGPFGLFIAPRDLARLGQLVLDQGRYNQRQLLSADFLAAATQPQVQLNPAVGYGYQWWVYEQGARIAAEGHGGQRLIVLPNENMVIVITAAMPIESLANGPRWLTEIRNAVQSADPLPPNPTAEAELAQAIAAFGSATPQVPDPIPAGLPLLQPFSLPDNPLGWSEVTVLPSTTPAEINLQVVLGSALTHTFAVGLDGVARTSPHPTLADQLDAWPLDSLPRVAVTGRWLGDEAVLILRYSLVGVPQAWDIALDFRAPGVVGVQMREITTGTAVFLSGVGR